MNPASSDNRYISFNISTFSEDLRRDGGRRMKNKRIRTIFTPEQLERMEDEFNKYEIFSLCQRLIIISFSRTQYMVGHDRVLLASRLNLTEAQVWLLLWCVWLWHAMTRCWHITINSCWASPGSSDPPHSRITNTVVHCIMCCRWRSGSRTGGSSGANKINILIRTD